MTAAPEASASAVSEPAPLVARWLGRMAFDRALALQLELREAILAGTGEPTLLLVEHPPVLTIGRRGSRADILWTDEQLAAAGVAVCETPRGGQVTLHAPGQLVAYPVVRVGRRIREHLEDLGACAQGLLEELGVEGCEFRMDHPGIWIGEVKLASMGVHISRGVAVQGLSVNLDVEPRYFASLVSCGLRGISVVSATTVGGRKIAVEAAARRFADLYAARTNMALRCAEPSLLVQP